MAMQHLWMLLNAFYKKHLKKLMAISPPIDEAFLIAKLIIKPSSTTQKRGRSAKATSANKRAKNN